LYLAGSGLRRHIWFLLLVVFKPILLHGTCLARSGLALDLYALTLVCFQIARNVCFLRGLWCLRYGELLNMALGVVRLGGLWLVCSKLPDVEILDEI